MALLPTWLLWILSPLGKYVAIIAIALAAYGAWDLRIRYDERNKVYQKQEVQRTNAVNKGNAARARAVHRYGGERMRDDGFRRD